jgi:hypothetical protein
MTLAMPISSTIEMKMKPLGCTGSLAGYRRAAQFDNDEKRTYRHGFETGKHRGGRGLQARCPMMDDRG